MAKYTRDELEIIDNHYLSSKKSGKGKYNYESYDRTIDDFVKEIDNTNSFVFGKPGRRKEKKYHHKKERNIDQEKNIQVFAEIQDYFSELKVKESTLYSIHDLYSIEELGNLQTYEETIIEVENEDTLDMALRFLEDDTLNILVLNMASEFKPGGGVETGAQAQEEEIFRRTNAFMTHPPHMYPLDDDEVIYSPEVYIVKDKNYETLKHKEQRKVSMIAVPAIRKPKLKRNEYIENDYNLMVNKIESIFKIALMNDHDSLILGALGCGAFCNPPTIVSQIFNDMIKKYKKYFKKIGFAILIVHDRDNDNINIFRDVFEKKN